jgi:hypothetical protein
LNEKKKVNINFILPSTTNVKPLTANRGLRLGVNKINVNLKVSNFNLNSCNNSTQAMFIADMRVFACHSKETHHHKLVRLLVNVYCKHALIIESTRDVGQSKMSQSLVF